MECPKCGLLCHSAVKRCDCGFGFDGSGTHPPRGAQTTQELVVTDIRMPFTSMVVFMVKWAIASIPALAILAIIGMVIGMVMVMLFGGTLNTLFR